MYEMIKKECLKSTETNPIALAVQLMKLEEIPMHGPIHHIIDGAALLTALKNSGMKPHFDLASALDEIIDRGNKMPGATCGKWGMCGSASSMGAALSIIHGTSPLSNTEEYKRNLRLVSEALGKIAEIGGPRCCKRNAFLSIGTAVEFVEKTYGIALPTGEIKCGFSPRNQQCIKEKCPFYKG